MIPSFKRPKKLSSCLDSLSKQTLLPDEVIVVWQGDDVETRNAASEISSSLSFPLKLLHNIQPNIVAAENTAFCNSKGDIILLCDDDITAPANWIEKHVSFYSDSTVGAVGGPADNYQPDLSPFPKRRVEPIGKLSWFGKIYGNMYDHDDTWKCRSPQEVEHLVGYNFSFRRVALDSFEDSLKPYWQMFELEACLKIKSKGYRIIFDFSNVVNHYPTNTAYKGGRDGDLQVKIYNACYNQAFILSKHSARTVRGIRLAYLLLVGSTGSPGFLSSLWALKKYGKIAREFGILIKSTQYKFSGWRDGSQKRLEGYTNNV
ncbi:glycosyltransferase [Leptothoe sp. LEGE 181152]|nr:glycosyltransferase [Leptothoe sp. LEGE 181152]